MPRPSHMSLEVWSGQAAKYNITTPTVILAAKGRLVQIAVVVAGAAAGTANDCATTGAAAASNQFCSIPNTISSAAPVLSIDWPCNTGIVIVPGSGQTLAVTYSSR